MKQLLFLLLFPCFALAQYTSNGNQKISLGEQTTADGLVFRGVANDTNVITPFSDTSAYIILDTVNSKFYHYNRTTTYWALAVGGVTSFSAGSTGLTPSDATTGAVTLGGTLAVANGGTGADMSSLPNNFLVRKNSSGVFDTAAIFEAEGKVGIGTTSPLNVFQIGTAFPINFNANYPQIQFNSYLQGGAYKVASSGFGSTIYLNGANGTLLYQSGDSTAANSTYTATTKFVINKLGNIGIGTESPNFEDFSTNSKGIQISNTVSNFAGIRLTGNTLFTTGSLGIYSGGGIHYFWGGGENPMVFATNDVPRMRIASGGEVLIAGTTDQGAYNLQVNGTGVWGADAYVNGSDANIKENIVDLDSSLNIVNNLKPVIFNYINTSVNNDTKHLGFIAQDVYQILENKDYLNSIVRSDGETLSIAYSNLIPILVKAIQEQNALIKALEQRILTLENK